jgi:glycosyltransferase involved in cell wall biosynthesis
MTMVSVIVPAYNEERWIGESLASLRAQTLRDFELIVVDDGSTDTTAALSERAGARVIRTAHRGAGAARDHGARASSGQILVFADADDVYSPDFLERLIHPFIDRQTQATFPGGVAWHNPRGGLASGWLRVRGASPASVPCYGEHHPFPKAVRRDAFLAAGGYPHTGYGEDEAFGRRLGPARVVRDAEWRVTLPTSVGEIWSKARWIGRGPRFERERPAVWRLTPPWSMARALGLIAAGAPAAALVRLIYDAGLLTGLIESRLRPHLRDVA